MSKTLPIRPHQDCALTWKTFPIGVKRPVYTHKVVKQAQAPCPIAWPASCQLAIQKYSTLHLNKIRHFEEHPTMYYSGMPMRTWSMKAYKTLKECSWESSQKMYCGNFFNMRRIEFLCSKKSHSPKESTGSRPDMCISSRDAADTTDSSIVIVVSESITGKHSIIWALQFELSLH